MTETALLNRADQFAPIDPVNAADFQLNAADMDYMHNADVAAAGIDLNHTAEPQATAQQDPFGLNARPANKFDGLDFKAPAPYSIPQAGPAAAESDFKVSVPTAEQMAAQEEAKFLSYAADAAKIAVAAYTEKEAVKAEEEAAAAAAHVATVEQGKAMQHFLIEEDEKKPALV